MKCGEDLARKLLPVISPSWRDAPEDEFEQRVRYLSHAYLPITLPDHQDVYDAILALAEGNEYA